MRLVIGEDAKVAAWAASRIPYSGNAGFGPCRAIGVEDVGGLIAGCVYHAYIDNIQHMQVSIAADTPKFCSRGVMRALLHYPFEQQECRTISLITPHTSARVHRFVKGFGFTRRGCLPEFFAPGVHGEVYSMTRHDYDRLRERIG